LNVDSTATALQLRPVRFERLYDRWQLGWQTPSADRFALLVFDP